MGMRAPATISSLEALAREATDVVESLVPKKDTATLVTLSGSLGAGKTAFVQAAAQALGIDEQITSPTFVLAKAYALPEGLAFTQMLHIDAYRLTSGAELASIGFFDAYKNAGTLILLEWPEMVADTLPDADLALHITTDAVDTRTITYGTSS